MNKFGITPWQHNSNKDDVKVEIRPRCMSTASYMTSESSSSIATRLSLLQVAQDEWKAKVEEKDVEQFTVKGKMSRLGKRDRLFKDCDRYSILYHHDSSSRCTKCVTRNSSSVFRILYGFCRRQCLDFYELIRTNLLVVLVMLLPPSIWNDLYVPFAVAQQSLTFVTFHVRSNARPTTSDCHR